MDVDLTEATVELLQTLIRNRCVNDGTASSGQEIRNADVLEQVIDRPGVLIERFDALPGRRSVIGRLEGSDPDAPSLCLMGHTDVVPVNPDGWTEDPFGGERIGDEIWGRGAVDMLNLTASMAVVFRHLADEGFRPRGDLLFFGVADEESGSEHGARWVAEHHVDSMRADYVLTENGGLHAGTEETPKIVVNVAEKGAAWRRLRIRGVPGHGSQPYGADNALVTAAAVVQRISEYSPAPRFHELWRSRVASLDLDEESEAMLLDEDRVDDFLAALPPGSGAGHLHACCHTTFSVNELNGDMKTNVIPDTVDLGVDIRIMPGEDDDTVAAHLQAALGDLAERVEVSPLMSHPPTSSRVDTPLWDALQRAVNRPFPTARLDPAFTVGFTDARVYRELGSVAYGAGLLSPSVTGPDFGRRFHGNDERIDVESLSLTTGLYLDVVRDLLG